MFALLNPFQNARDFDLVTIAGMDTPGVAKVSKPKRAYQWDKKIGKGLWGTTTTFTGRVPSEFSIEVSVWTKEQWYQWEALINKLQYDPTKIRFNPETLWTSGVKAVDIYYPTLVHLNINSVVIDAINNMSHQGKGLWTGSIDCLEWFPPPRLSVVATPAGSTDIQGVKPSNQVANLEGQVSGLKAQLAAAYK